MSDVHQFQSNGTPLAEPIRFVDWKTIGSIVGAIALVVGCIWGVSAAFAEKADRTKVEILQATVSTEKARHDEVLNNISEKLESIDGVLNEIKGEQKSIREKQQSLADHFNTTVQKILLDHSDR